MTQTNLLTCFSVQIQETLRPARSVVFGCKKYGDQKQLIERIDLILRKSGIEQLFVRLSLREHESRSIEVIITEKEQARVAE